MMRVYIVTDDTTRPEDHSTLAAENFGKATDTNVATSLHDRWTAI